ncbi:MAG: response regulator [Deltaproteobacteria bacterium]|nr:response regulator [Deltaproteobacteria bacterium]
MGEKVLVIDDEPDVLTYITSILKKNGYNYVTASDGVEGMEKAKAENPDLITLDLLMPERTGIKMYRELKKDEDLKNIPVIMVTGIASQASHFADFKKFIYERKIPGPEGYIEKPFKPEDLLTKIKAATAEK